MRLWTAFLLVSAVAMPALAQIAEPPPPNSPTTGTAAATGTGQQLEEVGFDPKVKRDPYGNVIGTKSAPTATTTGAKPLRSDGTKAMRSDRNLMKAAPSAAPGSSTQTLEKQTLPSNAPTAVYTNPTTGDGGIGSPNPSPAPTVNANSPHP